ncbi:uncharacterized protein BJ212DRAFT_756726 [Suillus subaureus]|uniref:Anaphase-promoting complex subunit 4 WD40 domain-containing protein n=1 Tax=Suillus subaureus TaxID=48587 RepID=A0A9P7DZN1_9AGAM|nr:uncharacterized protein BJ212DRAFT_756726 [Suillus subaureus]KAG1807281.1 hypothetical protein BJ212DRAFT_756726 [Suillus subaureus]
MFWTKNIIAAFSFTGTIDALAMTIYEFDASTLQTVGTPFEGHTDTVTGLALSFDEALLASASFDDTIRLWDCESRQLLASFDVQKITALLLSPDSRQLAYKSYASDDHEICICDTPPDVLTQATGRRRPLISTVPVSSRPLPTIDPQQPVFVRLRKFLSFSSHTNAVHPIRNDQPRDPLDFSATLPLPRPLLGHTSTQGRPNINSGENSQPERPHLSFDDCFCRKRIRSLLSGSQLEVPRAGPCIASSWVK